MNSDLAALRAEREAIMLESGATPAAIQKVFSLHPELYGVQGEELTQERLL